MGQSLQRATEIMELIAEKPRTADQVAVHFDVHRSTVFRQLQTLAKAEFVLHRSDGKCAIGSRVIAMAQQTLDSLDLRQIAYEELRALHERVGFSIHLAQLLEDRVLYIDKVDSPDGIRMYSRVGRSVDPKATGVGKAILAQLGPTARDQLLRDADWTPRTATTHPSRESLDRELETVRANGWAADDGEFEEFVNCIAAPITNTGGTVVGALSISAIRVICPLDRLKTHLDELLATSRRISRQLG